MWKLDMRLVSSGQYAIQAKNRVRRPSHGVERQELEDGESEEEEEELPEPGVRLDQVCELGLNCKKGIFACTLVCLCGELASTEGVNWRELL